MHSDKMKQRLDTTSTETAFKPGDAVWLYAPKRMKGKSPKLQINWEGPYTIIKKINDLVYRIQLSTRSKPKVVHLERLARYTGHNPPDWFVVEDPPPRTEDSGCIQLKHPTLRHNGIIRFMIILSVLSCVGNTELPPQTCSSVQVSWLKNKKKVRNIERTLSITDYVNTAQSITYRPQNR
ncbi:hypothetical protein NQ318_004558 [Aromia moschata]|uniref:Integrase p58-like C-terminal domain-containing protein n=1 Tax=Aromia moschata TaxID=1265417 RepID=A0AAV8Y8Y2_9CUCU|nr:hypothetical protein NQ318_004558 [Aromia moschata]